MAGDWIKLRTDLHDQPEVIGIGQRCGLDIDAVVGKLHRVWAWADRVTADGAIPHVTRVFVDGLARKKGFAEAMVYVGWLTDLGDGLSIPNFNRHNGRSAKRRAAASVRSNELRKQRDERDELRTECARDANDLSTNCAPREEKRRKNASHSPPLPPDEEIPKSLETPEFRAAWADWLGHRAEKRKKVTANSAAKAFARMAKWGVERAVLAINFSIAQGWDGIYEEKENGQSERSGNHVGSTARVRAAAGKYAGLGTVVDAAPEAPAPSGGEA